ncbi:class I fructose-bisphosphate aldolase [Metabacillus malikii]|uniref:DhnA family fructose-bisphosphate aldolase class Ia n=1 Tax=Metabacillus malikii TaxID=1504265 RepID=A0ABT9Z9Z1_9BACI|nr:deoxyribose-phosphate aldolase [Metabacillus malikii]MDQ0229066.1 DhnA family fructose-bisphosphate aldolase class Ia [Metabacillus malikii]
MVKAHRLNRLIDSKSNRSIFLPIDHGTSLGPLQGIRPLHKLVNLSIEHNIQAIIAHQGVIQKIISSGINTKGLEFLLHVSCSTSMSSDPLHKQVVSSVEHCLRLGVAGISVHVNLGVEKEYEMVRDLGSLCRKAYEWGVPVLTMINVHEKTVGSTHKEFAKNVSHGVRLAGELGSDFVKVQYPGSFEHVLDAVTAFDLPVLLSGGENVSNHRELFSQVKTAIDAGMQGACIGRNVFDDENPELISHCLNEIIHQDKQLDEVWNYYEATKVKQKEAELINIR